MRREEVETLKITSREILLKLVDFAMYPLKDYHPYKRSYWEYESWRIKDKEGFRRKINYLRRMRYIKIFTEGKEKFIELTPIGLERVSKLSINEIKIPKPSHWDKKWRVIIFDIPEKKHYNRDIFRDQLIEMGFLQLQKSVYVYPYECTNEIVFLSERLSIVKNVTIMISEIIQGEEEIMYKFIKNKVLLKSDISFN